MDSVNKWLMLVANLGVIAGIVFLAVEIGQNQEALDRQNLLIDLTGRDSAYSLIGGFRKLLLENSELNGIWKNGLEGQELSVVESNQFELICEERIFIAATLWERFKALDDAAAAQNQINALESYNSSSVKFKECWKSISLIIIDSGRSEFVEEVNSQ